MTEVRGVPKTETDEPAEHAAQPVEPPAPKPRRLSFLPADRLVTLVVVAGLVGAGASALVARATGWRATVTDEGTGIALTQDGQIVTNGHVVSGASSITVTLNGSNKAIPATVIASGQVIGITIVATSSRQNSANGIGIAIAAKTVTSLLPALRAGS